MLTGVLAMSACAAQPLPADPNVLMDADRAFDAAVAEGGSEAWGEWFAADGETFRGEGVYVSIWRSQTDGSWKVVMDLGNPTTAPGDGG
jgi:ketosteroid isomerase-like protein